MNQNYIEWLFPGSFVSENQIVKVPSAGFVPERPKRAFAYRHFTRTELQLNGETLLGAAKDHTGWTYFGEVFTLEQVKALDGDRRILISNMECNGWSRVVRTVFGQFMPLRDEDRVVAA